MAGGESGDLSPDGGFVYAEVFLRPGDGVWTGVCNGVGAPVGSDARCGRHAELDREGDLRPEVQELCNTRGSAGRTGWQVLVSGGRSREWGAGGRGRQGDAAGDRR